MINAIVRACLFCGSAVLAGMQHETVSHFVKVAIEAALYGAAMAVAGIFHANGH